MKAALILDEMPMKCIDCEYIFHNDQTDHYICGVPNNHIDIWNREIWTSSRIDKIERPDWCPLQEVEPVKHGHWIKSYEGGATRPRMNIIKCSICGWTWYNQQIGSAFCPGCGAKLDGGAE